MKIKLTETEKAFKNNFFKDNGILDSTMNHIQGKMQAEASIEECDELDESFFQNAMTNVLRRKAKGINKSFTVTSNKIYDRFNEELQKSSSVKLRIQPDFIIKDQNRLPLSVFELKSIFGSGTTKKLVLKDFVKLVLHKRLFPKSQCIFVIAGKKDEMKSFFEKSNFPFVDNVQTRISTPYSWKSIRIEEFLVNNENYLTALRDLNIKEILVRLSRTQYGERYHSMSYDIRVGIPGYRKESDFSEISWNYVNSGDFICTGLKPVRTIGQCMIVDNIDLKLQQVMYQTNDVDDQYWQEIDLGEIVWRYEPQGSRY